jgi:hypothetical protein
MKLNEFAAGRRLAIFERLQQGLAPHEGEWDEALLREARSKGQPQLGATRYEPQAIFLEFIYPDPQGAAVILTVRLQASERIVYLPVPKWVVESIWQGEISGSYHFESDAKALLEEFSALLAPDVNSELFGLRQPVGRG